jgi:hypothetical protein
MRTKPTIAAVGLAGALFALGTATANAAPAAPVAPQPGVLSHCPAAGAASYQFSCQEQSPDTLRICAPSKGCADQSFDKLGNLVCQKVQYGVQTPAGVPLRATDFTSNVYYGVCDMEMSIVRALPPVPVGGLLPAFNG